jgi:replicative DNA helicase
VPDVAHREAATVPVDPVNEVALLARAISDQSVLDLLLRRLQPDHWQVREHREAWVVLGEVRRKGLAVDYAAIRATGGDAVAEYLTTVEMNADSAANVDWHVGNLLWDYARATAARGPVTAFLEALKDPKAEPGRVRSFARQIAMALEGHEDRKHLLDSRALVRDHMMEIEARVAGRACYSYGIPGLDYFDPELRGRRRMTPGPAPGQFTVLTGMSGGGKSTMAANMALGMAFPEGVDSDAPGRRVLYCAWEMSGGMTSELIACVSLGWSRSDLVDPDGAAPGAPIHTQEGRLALQTRMERIGERIKFLSMPFRRRPGEKPSNEKNLDVLQGYIADAGCDVVIADLWKRALRDTSPDEEEDALVRQQAMVEDLKVHMIALQQQRLKDVEQRPDKRPTREGIKGSGAWVEVADTIIGVHRPALWKRMTDDTLEAIVLKQRYGRWPLAAEFEWDADRGSIKGGRHVEYERPGEANEMDGDFLGQKPAGRRKRVT